MSTATATKEKTEFKLDMPNTYSIVIFDDPNTPLDVVLDMLQVVLGHDEDTAFDIIMTIQDENKAVAKSNLVKQKAEELKNKCVKYVNDHSTTDKFHAVVEKEMK